MLKRSSHLLIRVLAFLVSALLVLSVLAAWRLAQGPVAIDGLTPYIRDAVLPPDSDLDLEIGGSELRFGGERVVTCVLLDVLVLSDAGDTVLAAPEVEVDFSLSALARAAIAPTRLEMAVRQLVLVRTPDGAVGLRGGAAAAREPPEDPDARLDLQRLAASLLEEPAPDRPLSYLKRVEISGERLILDDQVTGEQIEARRGSLRLERSDVVEGRLAFQIPRPGRTVRAVARGRFDGRQLTLQGDLGGLMPADLQPYVDAPILSGLGLRMRAHARTAIDLAGDVEPIAFRLSGAGTVDLPEHLTAPLRIDRLRVEGRLASDLNGARLARLELRTHGASLEAEGRATWGEGDLVVQGEARARNVRVEDFDRLWPTTAAVEARKWAIPNVQDGVVEEAFVAIDIQPGDLEREPIPRTLATGWFSYQDLTVQYFEGFPLIEGIDGRAWFDGWVLAFAGGGGTSRDLTLESGRVAITGMTVPGKYATQLHVLADVTGPVSDALDLIDREPLGFPSRLGIDPAKTSGTARTRLQLGLPLYKEVEAEVLDVTANADLEDVAIEQLFEQVDVREGDLDLTVAGGSMTLAGTATVQEIPLALSLTESFAEGATEPRRLRVEADLTPASLARLGVPDDLPLEFEGAIGAEVDGSESADGALRLDVALDLARAGLALPLAGWQKQAGAPGKASAVVTVPESGAVRIDPLRIESSGLDVAGRLDLTRGPMGLELAEFKRFDVGEQRLSGRLSRQGGGIGARIRATSLVLDPLLDTGFASEDEGDDAGHETPLQVDLEADRVTLNERTVEQLRLKADRGAEGWTNALLTARLPGDKPFEAALAPAGDHHQVSVTSEDAGALISMLAEREPVTGGRLRLEGQLLQQRPELDFSGDLTLDEFTIKQAPTLARILTLLSAQGIEDVVAGRRLAMTRLELPFHLTGDQLVLGRGRTWGSGLGLTLEGQLDLAAESVDVTGTVLPAYGLNWAIGKIPVIGNFLAGSDGEGAFAATYSVRGPFAEPAVKVNPLTVLAPGFLRDLFGGKGKPPEMLPDTSN